MSMKTDRIQWIKGFAFCDSALGQGPDAEEELHRSHCRSAGRPICSGENRKSSNSGGHKNEKIKLVPAVELAGAESGVISMDGIVFSALKLYGIDVDHKIICQLSGQEVA